MGGYGSGRPRNRRKGSQLTAFGHRGVLFKELRETPPKKSLNVRFCKVLRCWRNSLFTDSTKPKINVCQHFIGSEPVGKC
jgi:hypothetical protein